MFPWHRATPAHWWLLVVWWVLDRIFSRCWTDVSPFLSDFAFDGLVPLKTKTFRFTQFVFWTLLVGANRYCFCQNGLEKKRKHRWPKRFLVESSKTCALHLLLSNTMLLQWFWIQNVARAPYTPLACCMTPIRPRRHQCVLDIATANGLADILLFFWNGIDAKGLLRICQKCSAASSVLVCGDIA